MSSEHKRNTIAKGELTKINLEGCRSCGLVYVSPYNATRLFVQSGWYERSSLQQKSPGDKGLDVVLRVRGTMLGGKGNRLCPTCKEADTQR